MSLLKIKTRSDLYRKKRKIRCHVMLNFSIPLKLLLLPKSPIRRQACTFLFMLTKENFISKISESIETLTSGWFMWESQQLNGERVWPTWCQTQSVWGLRNKGMWLTREKQITLTTDCSIIDTWNTPAGSKERDSRINS